MPKINIDGNSVSSVTIDGQPVQEITVDGDVAWLILEDWENGDKSGNTWSGDTGNWSVQTGRTANGTYAARSDGGNGKFMNTTNGPMGSISRPYTFIVWLYPTNADDFSGSKMKVHYEFVDSNNSYYIFHNHAGNNGNGRMQVKEVDGGSTSTICTSDVNESADQWFKHQVDVSSDGTHRYRVYRGGSTNIVDTSGSESTTHNGDDIALDTEEDDQSGDTYDYIRIV